MKKLQAVLLIILTSYVSLVAQQELNREILPIIPPEPATYKELDARNTKPPAPFNVTAPKDAPNVIVVLFNSSVFRA